MDRIQLKGTIPSDYDAYYKIRCSPADVYWNGYTEPPEKESFKKLFLNRLSTAQFIKDGDRRLYLIQLANGKKESVGFVQLIKHDDGVEIGYTVIEEYQGNGYATEALSLASKLAKEISDCVYVRIRDDNKASQKVALKCGFISTNHISTVQMPIGKLELRKYVT